MSAATADQIRAIHTLKSRVGLDDETYRDLLQQQAGVRSSKRLTISTAIAVIDNLKMLAGQKTPLPASPTRGEVKKAKGALNLSGPYAGICRALWISGYELGVFAHREDTALAAFVKRQTGLESLNWLRDAEPARAVIEALKGWIAREAGVRWPGRNGTASQVKQAVIGAQQRLLGEVEIVVQGDLDAAIRAYGARVRAMKAGRAGHPSSGPAGHLLPQGEKEGGA